MISPENFVGYSEMAKIQAIVKIFDDAYKELWMMLTVNDILLMYECEEKMAIL